ncbi:hypothetical protein [Hydrocarboniphaga sp.]|uniref:hypothetical protein n=1 Tax=Hydrocarboniphaga sp. TaxID=2033016 RepID=UPI002609189F|nr:hypothetical protein [Hydrocarboniphaga sp.]
MTCIDVKEPISFTGHYGIASTAWTTRLERGPYWSEKEDEKGTFYRAPPGGISIADEKGVGIPGMGTTTDGGFYVPKDPKDPKDPITTYRYFTTKSVPAEPPPAESNCTTVGYSKDPTSTKVSFVSFAVGGALGGASGGIVGRAINQGSNISYGQSAGAGAAGGLAGGLIVAAIINADIGKITGGMPIQDAQFEEKLKALSVTKVPLKEVQISESEKTH